MLFGRREKKNGGDSRWNVYLFVEVVRNQFKTVFRAQKAIVFAICEQRQIPSQSDIIQNVFWYAAFSSHSGEWDGGQLPF